MKIVTIYQPWSIFLFCGLGLQKNNEYLFKRNNKKKKKSHNIKYFSIKKEEKIVYSLKKEKKIINKN